MPYLHCHFSLSLSLIPSPLFPHFIFYYLSQYICVIYFNSIISPWLGISPFHIFYFLLHLFLSSHFSHISSSLSLSLLHLFSLSLSLSSSLLTAPFLFIFPGTSQPLRQQVHEASEATHPTKDDLSDLGSQRVLHHSLRSGYSRYSLQRQGHSCHFRYKKPPLFCMPKCAQKTPRILVMAYDEMDWLGFMSNNVPRKNDDVYITPSWIFAAISKSIYSIITCCTLLHRSSCVLFHWNTAHNRGIWLRIFHIKDGFYLLPTCFCCIMQYIQTRQVVSFSFATYTRRNLTKRQDHTWKMSFHSQ